MAEETKPDPAQAEDNSAQADTSAEHDHDLSVPESADEPDAVEETVPVDESDPAAAEIAALKDQVLRAKAETENIRRRSARELENAHKYAVEKFAAELLPVIDSLEKALETAGADVNSQDATAEGVALCLKLFEGAFQKAGVETLDPLGEPFDPTFHEAMAMVENPDAEPNSVMDVMQKGYVLNGRVMRAAKVIVVKAQPVDTTV